MQHIMSQTISRAIASAFIGSGDGAVANNIVNSTVRIQRWSFDYTKDELVEAPPVDEGEQGI